MSTMKPVIALSRRLPQPVIDALSPHGELRLPPGEAGLDAAALADLMAPAGALSDTPSNRPVLLAGKFWRSMVSR